jgi:hypothetical protein
MNRPLSSVSGRRRGVVQGTYQPKGPKRGAQLSPKFALRRSKSTGCEGVDAYPDATGATWANVARTLGILRGYQDAKLTRFGAGVRILLRKWCTFAMKDRAGGVLGKALDGCRAARLQSKALSGSLAGASNSAGARSHFENFLFQSVKLASPTPPLAWVPPSGPSYRCCHANCKAQTRETKVHVARRVRKQEQEPGQVSKPSS